MTSGSLLSFPVGIPVRVSTMKNRVVNSFLSLLLSLFCSLFRIIIGTANSLLDDPAVLVSLVYGMYKS